jgi:hypothetical protein
MTAFRVAEQPAIARAHPKNTKREGRLEVLGIIGWKKEVFLRGDPLFRGSRLAE